MITKTELELYARIVRLKDRIINNLNDIYPFYLIILLMIMPIYIILMCIIIYYNKTPINAKPYNTQIFNFMFWSIAAISASFHILVMLAFLVVGLQKLLQMCGPLQRRLMDYTALLSPEYKKTYKFMVKDDLIGLLKERNYNLFPNSTVSLLNEDDPRNTTYMILLLAEQVGAVTILKMLEAIQVDRYAVANILADDRRFNRLPASRNNVTAYLEQSRMDSLIAKLRSTHGWDSSYKAENFFNKIRETYAISKRYSEQDYACLATFISLHKKQLERATEKWLISFAQQQAQTNSNQGAQTAAGTVEPVTYTPQFKFRSHTPQANAQVYQDGFSDDEEAMRVRSFRVPRINSPITHPANQLNS